MKKKSISKINQESKNLMTVLFLFSLIIGIVLTTFLANNALGKNTPEIHAAGFGQ